MARNKGFTLIEMMIVVIIISILAGIAVPMYSKAVERSRISEAVNILGSIRDGEIRHALEHDNYTNNDLSELDVNVTAAGKYFDFVSIANGKDPFATNERIARATRNSVDAGLYANNYQIEIYENGSFWSSDTAVGAILQ